MIFLEFVESGKLRLDRAGSIGLGFGPLVLALWASLLSPSFYHRFFNDFGLPPGLQFKGSAGAAAPPIMILVATICNLKLCT